MGDIFLTVSFITFLHGCIVPLKYVRHNRLHFPMIGEVSLDRNVASSNILCLHNNLPFLPERMKHEKVTKLIGDLYDKDEFVVHIKFLKKVIIMD